VRRAAPPRLVGVTEVVEHFGDLRAVTEFLSDPKDALVAGDGLFVLAEMVAGAASLAVLIVGLGRQVGGPCGTSLSGQ